jgi:uncharacterized protein (TIGR03437 family)
MWVVTASPALAQSYAYFSFDPPAGAASMVVTGITNNGGILVAYTDAAGVKHSGLRSVDSAAYTAVELPGATWTWATAINNVGQIAGVYANASGTHSFLRSPDGKTFTSFDVPNTGAAAYGTPAGINDLGEIAGAGFSAGPVSSGFLRGADGTFATIDVPGASATIVTGINNKDEVVGWCAFGGSYGVRHGFVRDRAGNYRLVDLPGTLSGTHLAAVNNKEQMLIAEPHAFVLNPDRSTIAFDPTLSGTPGAIDDNGRVAGTTYSNGTYRGFLAVPSAGTQPTIRTVMGVESASGFGAFDMIAPGSWIEIYGTNLAPETRQWAASDFNGNAAPTALAGVKVTISGRPAFLSYASPGQVNAQVPANLPPGPALVTVTNNGRTSAGYRTTVGDAMPGLLSIPASEVGDSLLATFSDTFTFAVPPGVYPIAASRIAKSGDTLVLWGIGFGPTIPDNPAGQIATAADRLQGSLEIWFADKPVPVLYAGHSPGSVGLYEFVVAVPDGLGPPEGVSYNSVPVTCRLNGVAASQTLSLAIAR